MPCRVPKRRFSCGAPQHLTKNLFLCPIALMPMETIGSTGTVLKKSLDNLLVKAWGV